MATTSGCRPARRMAIEEALRLRDGRTLVFTSTGRAGSGGGAGPGTGDALVVQAGAATRPCSRGLRRRRSRAQARRAASDRAGSRNDQARCDVGAGFALLYPIMRCFRKVSPDRSRQACAVAATAKMSNVQCRKPNFDIRCSTLDIRCRSWRRPTLPRPRDRSTIGADRLNDRVRDGNGCGPVALVASKVKDECVNSWW